MVDSRRLELRTSSVSRKRSNQLSYESVQLLREQGANSSPNSYCSVQRLQNTMLSRLTRYRVKVARLMAFGVLPLGNMLILCPSVWAISGRSGSNRALMGTGLRESTEPMSPAAAPARGFDGPPKTGSQQKIRRLSSRR
jgi:hypothetical protein